ncbi:MAG: type II toxin-antitoxin system Phd/YefM family antitoxin [Planctomycetia bacterium]|nr:type II toxin-antitoxin system Phd/YefM family antitoxin [Planctomycetia bacterium]
MKRDPVKLPPDTVGVADAKRDLIALIGRVLASGRPITIARRGKPVARLVPCDEVIGPKWNARFTFPDDDPFFRIMRDIERRRKTDKARGTPQWPRD